MTSDRRTLSPGLLTQIGSWGALASAMGASVYLTVAHVYASAAGTIDVAGGPRHRVDGSATLAAMNGPFVFGWFGVTIVFAALPLLFRRTPFARRAATISATLLFIFVVLGSASIGGAYVPAAAFALLVAALSPSSRPATKEQVEEVLPEA